MAQPTKAIPIDAAGRMLITEAADTRVATAQLSVSDSSPTELTTGTSEMKRRKLFVRNALAPSSEVIIYIGDSNVTAASGFPLYHLDEIELDVDVSAGIYAITSSGETNGEVHVMETQ